jgi:DNA-binding NarL/FixJ family response regulator
MPDRTLRILIVAADALTRAGLSAILATESGLQTVGQLEPNEGLESALSVFQPDVILWDIGYGADDALNALTEFVSQSSAPEVPVLVLLADAVLAPSVWQNGVRALIPRSAPVATLASALRAVVANLVVLDPRSASSLLAPVRIQADAVEALTAREREVLQLMAKGLPNKSIARELAISEHTVKFHVNAILSKFGAQSRTEAVVLASRAGLVLL